MTSKYNIYFDCCISTPPTEKYWFEHSNVGFANNVDDRPIFHSYGGRSYTMDYSHKIRLCRELHDYLVELNCQYTVHVTIHPETFEPHSRCTITDISDESLLMLKLSHNVNIELKKNDNL